MVGYGRRWWRPPYPTTECQLLKYYSRTGHINSASTSTGLSSSGVNHANCEDVQAYMQQSEHHSPPWKKSGKQSKDMRFLRYSGIRRIVAKGSIFYVQQGGIITLRLMIIEWTLKEIILSVKVRPSPIKNSYFLITISNELGILKQSRWAFCFS